VVRESKKEGEAFKYGLARRSNEVADKCSWFWFMQKVILKHKQRQAVFESLV